ncbi:antibiotic biosynthesis monooxygenase [Ferrimonas sediminicola]|uniref:Antibiotic biosynthesis monooxygenase n=1 Tax=Ferrimonas sediminicola TaxID=2569538 RepID=A0A4U1BE92_9GAMM|nr:antibiotic biosynthesis monooxygenase [Ferrimonas sediminicola]TKB48947.1 antibiotic biosynthesis monooxygenase [Ferrimonas sediminicola]
MIAVILEIYPTESGKEAFTALSERLLSMISSHQGLVSIERFQSLMDEHKLLSLSFWLSQEDVHRWQRHLQQLFAEDPSSKALIRHYRVRSAVVVSDRAGDQRQLDAYFADLD